MQGQQETHWSPKGHTSEEKREHRIEKQHAKQSARKEKRAEKKAAEAEYYLENPSFFHDYEG
tara:strand:- start:398 stop:583 length:186 start_codon:yes stop_codon:yes gene_type:complete